MTPRAVVAEDEPLLARSLVAELGAAWPRLEVVAIAADGVEAVERVLDLRPEVVFLDIRMPGQTGLEAAEAIAEDWPDDAGPLPLLVFVTAYDHYAVAAFERAAFDYVLKPVEPQRLGLTCRRLEAAWQSRHGATEPSVASAAPPATELDSMLARLRSMLGAAAGADAGTAGPVEPLHVLQIGVGSTIRMVPVDDVVCFEAADKYIRVLTESAEHLIRMSLRDLLPRLDLARWWQVHRGTVVRADAVDRAERSESGKVTLVLRGRPERLAVSRLHAHRFRAM